MSVKDLIWVNVCQKLRLKRNYELEKVKREAHLKDMEQLVFLLADIRALDRDTNSVSRMIMMKGSGKKNVKLFPDDALPSVAIQKQREEQEKEATMTPEELELYRFNKGEKIKR